jgi:serine/threonine protein phosphatase PrpC
MVTRSIIYVTSFGDCIAYQVTHTTWLFSVQLSAPDHRHIREERTARILNEDKARYAPRLARVCSAT